MEAVVATNIISAKKGQAMVELVAGMVLVMVVVLFLAHSVDGYTTDWKEWAHYRLQHSIKFIKGIL